MNNKTVTIDVREDLQNGREPFGKIMNAVGSLGADEQLLLIAPFQPVPLFEVMRRRGFEYTVQVAKSGDWQVLFTRNSNGIAVSSNGAAAPEPIRNLSAVASAETDPQPVRRSFSEGGSALRNNQVIDLDARGLEPPQPLITILEAITTLADGAELRARTDRRPLHLYPHLEERGFAAETQEQPDGSFLTCIRRR